MRRANSRVAMMVGLIAGLAVGLTGALPAAAADLSAAAAKEIRSHLTSAFLTASQVSTEVESLAGKKAPDSLKRGLKLIDESAAAAERLANGHPNLQPGLEHVRTNTAKILADGKVDKSALSRMHESVAELHALIVNAAILEAVGDLNQAADALDKKDSASVTFYLQNAERALQDAAEGGAYHIENDIEEIQGALKDIENKVSSRVPVARAAIEQRAEEIKAHLFELGAEM
jgi:hypothetical protein